MPTTPVPRPSRYCSPIDCPAVGTLAGSGGLANVFVKYSAWLCLCCRDSLHRIGAGGNPRASRWLRKGLCSHAGRRLGTPAVLFCVRREKRAGVPFSPVSVLIAPCTLRSADPRTAEQCGWCPINEPGHEDLKPPKLEAVPYPAYPPGREPVSGHCGWTSDARLL